MFCFHAKKTIMGIIKKFAALIALFVVASPVGCIGNELFAEYNVLQHQIVTSRNLDEVQKTKFPATETKSLLRAIKEKNTEEVKTISKIMNLGSVSQIAEDLAK